MIIGGFKGAKCNRRCTILKIVEAPGGAEGGRPNASFMEIRENCKEAAMYG